MGTSNLESLCIMSAVGLCTCENSPNSIPHKVHQFHSLQKRLKTKCSYLYVSSHGRFTCRSQKVEATLDSPPHLKTAL